MSNRKLTRAQFLGTSASLAAALGLGAMPAAGYTSAEGGSGSDDGAQTTTPDVCKSFGISEATYCRWKREYGGMQVDQEVYSKVVDEELRG